MISTSHRLLFIHVPKTGGNSVASLLDPISDDDLTTRRTRQDGVDRFGLQNEFGLRKHATVAEWQEALGSEVFPQYRSFSVVRNTWDRLISLFFSPGGGRTTWDEADFSDFVSQARSALDFISVKTAAGPEVVVDSLLRFETLAEDYYDFASRAGLPEKYRQLPHRNRGIVDTSSLYSRELVALVGGLFAAEIELFGFSPPVV